MIRNLSSEIRIRKRRDGLYSISCGNADDRTVIETFEFVLPLIDHLNGLRVKDLFDLCSRPTKVDQCDNSGCDTLCYDHGLFWASDLDHFFLV